jgi:hypothetical protein
MSALSVNKREKKQNGLSRMENPKETLATLGTYDTGRRQTKHENKTQKTKKISTTDNTTSHW